MDNFNVYEGSNHECKADDFCTCSVCSRNKENGGYCNTCLTCYCGSRCNEQEASCFSAIKSTLCLNL